ncbi:MAG TPA: hypothetical protein VJX66_26150, partial [Amycolatopsis sp.]|nr:hypothetical protein [Amycolatopsis sp.]
RPGLGYLREQGDDHYIHEMKQARRMILDECRACVDLGYRGGVKYYVYRRIPAFYFLGVDLDDPINGRMLLSPYLGAHSRSAYPVQQLSRQSSAELFDKYLKAVDVVRNASLPVTS